MVVKNSTKKFLATVILITVALAPFLDSVACADCHLIPLQKGLSIGYQTITDTNKALSLSIFSASDKTSSENGPERSDIPCPFCVFNTFGVINNSHQEIFLSATSLLNPKKSLSFSGPTFLKTRPPKS